MNEDWTLTRENRVAMIQGMLIQLVNEAVRKEREECAELVKKYPWFAADRLAQMILERGNK